MSGIIQAARDQQRSRMPVMDRNRLDSQDKPNQDPKILDLSVLKDYVGKVLEHWKTESIFMCGRLNFVMFLEK